MFDISEFQERHAHIGHMCLQWAGLEMAIACIIWKFLKLDVGVGKIVTGGLDMGPRVGMAINLARKLNIDRRLVKALEETRATIQKDLIDKRNLLVHGFAWSFSDDPNTYVDSHRQGDRKSKPFATKDIPPLIQKIHDTTAHLVSVAVSVGVLEAIDPNDPEITADLIRKTVLQA